MQVLASAPLLEQLLPPLRQETAALIDRGIEPHLGIILVGENEESERYIRVKSKMAKEVGILASLYNLEQGTEKEVLDTLTFLGGDPEMHGIIIQLPLPESFSAEVTDQLLATINPQKDVDGLTNQWQAAQYSKATLDSFLHPAGSLLPPMVMAVCSLLEHYKLPLQDKKIVIVGKGRLVGQPLFTFFSKLGREVTAVDEETEGILAITQQADILVTGTGVPDLITYQWIKEGAVVIDCSGDVHFDSVQQVASALSPTPGGIGPLNTCWLLHNTIQTAKRLNPIT